MASYTVAELAERCGASVRGDGARRIDGVATLESAGPAQVAFVADARYREAAARTAAGALILTEDDARAFGGTALVSANPRLCFARVAVLFARGARVHGVHPTASVHPSARVAPDAAVEAGAIVEAFAEIGAGAVVGAGSYVGRGARLGEETELAPRVTVKHDCHIGRRCFIDSGSVIGSEGFGYVQDGAAWIKVPQLGRVLIGDDVDIGANCTVDRGALGDTVIGDGVKLDNLIQIAHNVQIGDHTAMAACVGVAGSAIIGRRCTIGGAARIRGHITIADDVDIAATSLVTTSIDRPGTRFSAAMPGLEASEWRRNAARFRQLDQIARRLKKLEQAIQRLFAGEKN